MIDTLTALKGLVKELIEYADNYHDVDCTGDPPRFVSNKWGEVLRIGGGMEALVERLEREKGNGESSRVHGES